MVWKSAFQTVSPLNPVQTASLHHSRYIYFILVYADLNWVTGAIIFVNHRIHQYPAERFLRKHKLLNPLNPIIINQGFQIFRINQVNCLIDLFNQGAMHFILIFQIRIGIAKITKQVDCLSPQMRCSRMPWTGVIRSWMPRSHCGLTMKTSLPESAGWDKMLSSSLSWRTVVFKLSSDKDEDKNIVRINWGYS